MVNSFKTTGDFFATSDVPRLEPFTLPRRWYSLANTAGWAFLTLPGVCYTLVSLLFSGSLYYFFVGVLLVTASEFFASTSVDLHISFPFSHTLFLFFFFFSILPPVPSHRDDKGQQELFIWEIATKC
jgi:hypothetical protein